MARDRCDATRWDKTQCGATECRAVQSERVVTHWRDAHKLDTQASRGGKREKSLSYQCCQSVKMQISWHANIYMCFVSMLGGCNYITARRKRQSKSIPPPKSNDAATSLHRCWFGVTLFINARDGKRLCLCEWWHFGLLLSEGLSARLSTPARSSSKCHLFKIHINQRP